MRNQIAYFKKDNDHLPITEERYDEKGIVQIILSVFYKGLAIKYWSIKIPAVDLEKEYSVTMNSVLKYLRLNIGKSFSSEKIELVWL